MKDMALKIQNRNPHSGGLHWVPDLAYTPSRLLKGGNCQEECRDHLLFLVDKNEKQIPFASLRAGSSLRSDGMVGAPLRSLNGTPSRAAEAKEDD